MYVVPKGHSINASFNQIMRKDKNFKDALDFKPKRFLNADKTEVVKNERFIPFSVGRRKCPGETLAKMELFLILVSLLQVSILDTRIETSIDDVTFSPLQTLRLGAEDPKNPPGLECFSSITSIPKPFNVRLALVNK